MKILMTGATGLIGTRVARALSGRGHELRILSRHPEIAARSLDLPCEAVKWEAGELLPAAALAGVGAVLNLAGESIAEGRWTEAKKKRIYDSRVNGTRALAKAILALPPADRPSVLASASAVGIYGDRGDEKLSEESAVATDPSDFLARVCRDWELETFRAEGPSTRAVAMRFGVVLAPRGGALEAMLPVFKLGLGGPLGSGRQWMSWIHVEDLVEAIIFTLTEPRLRGPVCFTSPGAVTNREFTRALGAVLSRPAWLPTPAVALKLALGEKSAIVLEGQKVVPARLLGVGFKFRFPELLEALRDTQNRSPAPIVAP